MIENAQTQLAGRIKVRVVGESVIWNFLAQVAAKRKLALPERGDVATEPILVARVNHGRWIVDCPWCRSAQDVDPDDLVFFCLDCGSEAVDGKWCKVEIPASSRREKLETILAARPDARNRNWEGESVAELARENRDYGIDA